MIYKLVEQVGQVSITHCRDRNEYCVLDRNCQEIATTGALVVAVEVAQRNQ